MSDDDRQRGLYRKYDVRKVLRRTDQRGDPEEVLVPLNEPCFVLRYTTDPYARAALREYANACVVEYPWLASDLRDELEKLERSR